MDPVLKPLLNIPPFLSVLIISFVISLVITLIYKLLTDQKKMKELREGIKLSQEELKKHRNDPKKMMEIQKKAMEKNMVYMTSSFKPTLVTMIPMLLIFIWLNANMTYEPIKPGMDFRVTALFDDATEGNVTLKWLSEDSNLKLEVSNTNQEIKNNMAYWSLKGDSGEYSLSFEHNGDAITYNKGETYNKKVIISEERKYASPAESLKNSVIKKVEINNKPVIYIPIPFKFLWWSKGGVGFLGTYILLSLLFSTLLRKLLKIY